MSSRVVTGVAAAAAALALLVWRAGAPATFAARAPDAAPSGPAPREPGRAGSGPGRATANPDAGTSPAAPPRAARTPLDRWVDPATLSPEELEARRHFRVEQAERARAAYAQHPPFSRPLRENQDLLVPEQIAPVVRPLAAPDARGSAGAVAIRQTQDRIYLRPGTVAVVGLEATSDGRTVPVTVRSAVLVRSAGSPPVASEPVLQLPFTPSGAGATASFAAPAAALGSYTGDLLLRVDAEAAGERGDLVFAFVYTGEPPAVFTSAARDRLERGAVVFGVAVDVRRPGRYRITGRVDDARGVPLALARFDGELPAGLLEIPLVLFGKIARDEGGTAPFVLRDVEGFRLLDGVYPDRETMASWVGPHRSRAYGLDALSPAAWTNGDPAPAARPW